MIRNSGLAAIAAVFLVGCVSPQGTTKYNSHDNDIYYPAGNTQFVFVEKDNKTEYTIFCTTPDATICPPLAYQDYVGKRGYFVGKQPVKIGSRQYIQVKLQKGSTLYFDVTGHINVYGDKSQIQSVTEYQAIKKAQLNAEIQKARHEQEKKRQAEYIAGVIAAKEREKAEQEKKYSMTPEPLVPGSKIMLLEKVDIYSKADGFLLSNGEKHLKYHIETIRTLSKKMKKSVATADHLLNSGYIQYDEFDDQYFIKSYDTHESLFRLGFTVSGGIAYPTFYVKYRGYDWIFADHYILKADNEQWTYARQPFDHNNSAWDVTEWSQRVANARDVSRVRKLIKSESAKVKIAGKYQDVFEINPKMRKGLEWSVKFYDLTR